MNTRTTAVLLVLLLLVFASTCSQPAAARTPPHQRQPDAAQHQPDTSQTKDPKKCNRPRRQIPENWLTRAMHKTGRWLRGLPEDPQQPTPGNPAPSTPRRNNKP